MNRRLFLKMQLKTLAYLSAGATLLSSGIIAPSRALASGLPDVVVAKGSPAAATRASVEALGGMSRFVKKGQSVVIKPNMSFAQGVDSATTTHPEVVKEILIMCKEAGAGKIRILDHPLQNPQRSLENSGIRDSCNTIEEGICYNLLGQEFYTEQSISSAEEMKKNAFMKDVLTADVIIAVPVAKSHGSAGVSLALKGQMGLIFDRMAMHSRYNLHNSIVDLNYKIKPHLSIIDATRVLTTRGPSGPGEVIRPQEVIASTDPVAADATAVANYVWYDRKIQPNQVAHIKLAHERGLGRMDIENLKTTRLAV